MVPTNGGKHQIAHNISKKFKTHRSIGIPCKTAQNAHHKVGNAFASTVKYNMVRDANSEFRHNGVSQQRVD